jgi:hypothetical protein
MALHNHAGVPVGRARPSNHHFLNLATHEDLPSLLQSNVSSSQLERWPLTFYRAIKVGHCGHGADFARGLYPRWHPDGPPKRDSAIRDVLSEFETLDGGPTRPSGS